MDWKSLLSTNSSLNTFITEHSIVIGSVMAYILLALFIVFIWYKRKTFLDFYAESFAKWQYKIWKLEEKWSKEKKPPKKDSEDSSMAQ